MTGIEIKAAAERLKLETELSEAERKRDLAETRVRELKGDLSLLENNPECYFGMQQKIQELFKPTQQ